MKKANERLEVTEALNLWSEKYAPPHINLDSFEVMKRVGEAAHFLHERNRLTLVNLIEAVRLLDVQGLLDHKKTGPTVVVVEKPVPVEKKLSKADRLQQVGLVATADRAITTEFDRAEKAKPRATEAALVSVAKADLEINSIMNDVVGMINGYRAGSHSLSFKRQEELRGIFAKFKNQVQSVGDAESLARGIKAKISSWDDSSIR